MSHTTTTLTPITFAPNFKGFYEDAYLLPYRDLFASEADALRGQQLDPCLVEMDQKEYEIVKLESEELNACAYKSPIGRIAGLFALIFAGVMAGVFWRGKVSSHYSLWNDGIPFNFMIMTWGSALLIAVVAERILLSYDCQRLDNKIDEISLQRRKRLEAKVSQLKTQLDKQNTTGEKEQIQFAYNKLSSNLSRHPTKSMS